MTRLEHLLRVACQATMTRVRGVPPRGVPVEERALDGRPCLGEAGDRGAQLVGRAGERHPDERVEPAVDGEDRPGRDHDATTFGLGHERGRAAARSAGHRELAPQRQAAARQAEAPVGELGPEGGRERVALLAQPPALVGPQLVATGEQPGRHELFQHGAAQVERHPDVHQPLEHAVGAAHPADPEAAPEALAGAPEGDRLGGEGGERPRHRPPVEGEGLVRLVDDGGRAGSS